MSVVSPELILPSLPKFGELPEIPQDFKQLTHSVIEPHIERNETGLYIMGVGEAALVRHRRIAFGLSFNPRINAPVRTIMSYDTYPPYGVTTLTDSNGAINLTSASSVTFIMKGIVSAAIITGNATIVSAALGTVSYTWLSTDTQQADSYQIEWKILWSGGGIQKVPNSAGAREVLEIDQDLDAAIG